MIKGLEKWAARNGVALPQQEPVQPECGHPERNRDLCEKTRAPVGGAELRKLLRKQLMQALEADERLGENEHLAKTLGVDDESYHGTH